MRNDSARLAEPEPELMEKPLALPDSETDPFFLLKMMADEFSIPEVLGVAQCTWRATQVFSKSPKDLLIQDARTTGAQALFEPCEAAFLETAHPVLDRARAVSQHVGNLIAAESVTDEQNAVEPVVVARLFRAHDLLLNGNLVDVSMFDFQSLHGTLLSA
jgi:hypothetical protein